MITKASILEYAKRDDLVLSKLGRGFLQVVIRRSRGKAGANGKSDEE